MIDPSSIQFHEATIVSVKSNIDGIILDIEEARHKGQNIDIQVSLIGIKEFTIDGAKGHLNAMLMPDGEILTFRFKENVIELIIEWHDFDNKKSLTKCYACKVEDIQFIVKD